MGIIISRFRKHPTIKEKLQTLVNDIKEIEEFKLHTQKRQKNIVGRFIIFSVTIFVSAAIVVYFLYLPERLLHKLLYMLPFLFFPFIIVFLKRTITWYYSRKIKRDEIRLIKLKDEKKKLLDEVMDKETYKNAKEILEKFAPEQLQKESSQSIVLKPNPMARPVSGGAMKVLNDQQELRRRTIMPPATPKQQQLPPPTPGWKVMPPATPMTPFQQRPTGPPLPRPVLPRERSVMDRLVEFIVGDGPTNRYALICRQCASHNGMALQEEFEYLAFRCCYCYTWNPARKQRPQAPLLPTSTSSQEQEEEGESSPSTASSEAGDAEADAASKSEENLQTEAETESKSAEQVPEMSETVENSSLPMVASTERREESEEVTSTTKPETAKDEGVMSNESDESQAAERAINL